jgi:3-oxoacyl-[acyl-carrier protein] reductase
MVLNLAKELGPLGINVNAIAPRVIQTEILDHLYPDEKSREKLINQIPIRRIGQPEDIAYMASFLASDKASYINGQILLLDGGRTHQ